LTWQSALIQPVLKNMLIASSRDTAGKRSDMTATKTDFSDMQVVPVAAQPTAIVRKEVLPSEMRAAQQHARALLANALKDAAVSTPAQSFTMWRPAADGKIDYAPGIFVPQSVKAAGDVALFTLPEGRAAHVKLTAGYEALPKAWQHLLESCKAQKLELVGVNWEVYTKADAGETQTDLYALLA
jgi:effector-binding domain-containing protein